MPIFYLRGLTSSTRTQNADAHLAMLLAFVAGATNAGGFLAVGQYTSHMSGIVSAMADRSAAGQFWLVADGLLAVIAFVTGAVCTAMLVRSARNRGLRSEYALPLMFEAILLVVFGIVGKRFTGERASATVMLLCFTMGLQNALITKISNAVIRTTHLTGMFTDAGIVLGRMVLHRAVPLEQGIAVERARLRLLGSLIGLFFLGGVTGALGFEHVGFLFTLPLAALLAVVAAVPVMDDVRAARRSA